MGLVPGRAPLCILFVIILLSEGYFQWVSGSHSRSVLVIQKKHDSALPVVVSVVFCPSPTATWVSLAICDLYRILDRLKLVLAGRLNISFVG